LQAYFGLAIPVDASCRWKIYFPSDMPLSSHLTTVSGQGLYSSLISITTLSVSNNYLEVDGCTEYQDGGTSAIINMDSVLNKGWVQETNTF